MHYITGLSNVVATLLAYRRHAKHKEHLFIKGVVAAVLDSIRLYRSNIRASECIRVQKSVCHLKYGTSCFGSSGLPVVGGAIVGDVRGGERWGDRRGVGSTVSILKTGTSGRVGLGRKNQIKTFKIRNNSNYKQTYQ